MTRQNTKEERIFPPLPMGWLWHIPGSSESAAAVPSRGTMPMGQDGSGPSRGSAKEDREKWPSSVTNNQTHSEDRRRSLRNFRREGPDRYVSTFT